MNTCSMLAAAVVCPLALAGPLDPPAGPVAPTNKTLQQVEPRIAINDENTPGNASARFIIDQPGSYYLERDLNDAASGQSGILIDADNITIDLMGYEISDNAPDTFFGIATLGSQSNITIRNGTVRGWPSGGISLGAEDVVLQNIRALDNGLDGISVGGPAVIESCVASGNGQDGIRLTGTGVMRGCASQNNGRYGLFTLSGALVAECVARNNSDDGIFVADGCTVTQSSAFDNGSDGILAGASSTVKNCTANTNTGIGILVNDQGVISACNASDNQGDGILTGSGSVVTDCAANANGGDGISALGGSTVSNCSVRDNAFDGIQVSTGCNVHDNTCDANGDASNDGAGIRTTGGTNRIDTNHLRFNDFGVAYAGSDNIIIRCTFISNTASLDGSGSQKIGEFTSIVSANVNAFANITD